MAIVQHTQEENRLRDAKDAEFKRLEEKRRTKGYEIEYTGHKDFLPQIKPLLHFYDEEFNAKIVVDFINKQYGVGIWTLAQIKPVYKDEDDLLKPTKQEKKKEKKETKREEPNAVVVKHTKPSNVIKKNTKTLEKREGTIKGDDGEEIPVIITKKEVTKVVKVQDEDEEIVAPLVNNEDEILSKIPSIESQWMNIPDSEE